MNRKYLLRGIGIGIIMGSLIMYAASSTMGGNAAGKDTSTEATMVAEVTTEATTEVTTEATTKATTEAVTATATESTSGDATTGDAKVEATTEEKTTEKKTTEEKTTEEKTTEEKTTEEKTTEEKTTEEKTTEATTEKPSDNGVKTITVTPGMGSEDVSALLKEAGLIKDDIEFNQWLIDNGYESSLSVGTFEIKSGASNEEIAKILTSHN